MRAARQLRSCLSIQPLSATATTIAATPPSAHHHWPSTSRSNVQIASTPIVPTQIRRTAVLLGIERILGTTPVVPDSQIAQDLIDTGRIRAHAVSGKR